MKYFQLFIIAVFFTFSLASNAFPIPDDNEVSFDVIRKNKVIGNLTSKFIKDDENIVLHSVLDINVKILFIPAYKFFQETKETWRNGEFISIDGFTDFEDDREYKIDGKDEAIDVNNSKDLLNKAIKLTKNAGEFAVLSTIDSENKVQSRMIQPFEIEENNNNDDDDVDDNNNNNHITTKNDNNTTINNPVVYFNINLK